MKQLIYLLLCAPLIIQAQGDTQTKDASTPLSMTDKSAIKWAQGLTWQQIKQKAKKENKYIFVDCYATWCRPCKQMDKEVYSVDSVGNYLNDGFISVRLQMDSTKNDDASIRSWYKIAKSFEKEYSLSAYPTMLFFTPLGEMASKEVGGRDVAAFMTTARNSKDPSKQYYVLLKNYRKGKKDYNNMPFLFNTAVRLQDTTIYRAVRDDYYAWLHALPKEKLYTKENIEFIVGSMSKSSQVVFDMFYPDGSNVNKVMGSDWYAKNFVDKMIEKEISLPFLNAVVAEHKTDPDWDALYNQIAKSYNGDYASRNVLNAKIKWHSADKDKLVYYTLLNDKIEKYGTDTTSLGEDFKLNNKAAFMFIEINDINQLNRAIIWMKGVARRGEEGTGDYYNNWGMYIDTYANLLYKVGRKSEALQWQAMAVAKGLERKLDDDIQKQMEENLKLMKQDKPTWPTK